MAILNRIPRTAPALLVAGLLQACGGTPPRPALAVTPLLRIDDARAELAAREQARQAAAPARAGQQTPAAAPAVPVAPAAATLTVAPSRMEVVQLGPNEYRLQLRQPADGAVAPAVAATTSATAVAAPVAAVPAAAIQIVNGNGMPGLGAHARRLLAGRGLTVAQVTNLRGYSQRLTVIEYLPGQQQRASAVLAALRGNATLRPARALPSGLTLRLMLGRDQAARIAALTPAAPKPAIALATAPAAPTLAALSAPVAVAVPHFNQE